MVNGAGLAMATMDIIQYAGGSPANFLDVGDVYKRQPYRQVICRNHQAFRLEVLAKAGLRASHQTVAALSLIHI